MVWNWNMASVFFEPPAPLEAVSVQAFVHVVSRIGFAHLLEEFSSHVVLLQEPLRKILFPPLLAYKEYLNFSIIWNTWQRYWVTSASRLPCVRDCSCAPAADGSHDGSVFNCSLTGLGGRTLSYRGLRGWPKERAVVFIQIDPL